MTAARRRVAITGVGAISAIGNDIPTLWSGILQGECGIAPIVGVPTDRLTVQIAAEVKGFDPARHFDARRLSMLDRVSQLALVAAREAIPSLDACNVSAERTGVVIGASLGQQTLD